VISISPQLLLRYFSRLPHLAAIFGVFGSLGRSPFLAFIQRSATFFLFAEFIRFSFAQANFD